MRYILLILTVAVIGLSSSAHANGFDKYFNKQQQPVRFYNSYGAYQGQATPTGSGYTFYNNYGAYQGQATYNGSNGYNYYNQYGASAGYSR